MQLINYLNSFSKLSEDAIQLLQSHLKTEVLPKGSHFLKSGERCRRAAFIEGGILRYYFYDANGNEFTHCFVTKTGFVTDTMAFYNQTLSTQYIVAETEVELTYFTFSSYNIFKTEIPEWENIIKKATDAAYAAKLMEKSFIISEDATTRYLNFARNHPEILQNVALKSIASFLGITKHSLSRIRKNLATNS
ncbi:MAG: cyclic nucleotide-binding domain-containing protein [Bacteroidota bacterium]